MESRRSTESGSLGLVVAVVVSLHVVATSGCQPDMGLIRGTGQAQTSVKEHGPMSVQVVEMWRTDVHADFHALAGMAAWRNGTVWVGDGENAEVWELQPDGSQARKVTWRASATNGLDEIRHLSVVGDSAFLILGRDELEMAKADASGARHVELPPMQTWSFVALGDGGFVVGGGAYPGDPNYGHSVHRFDVHGTLAASWHPGFKHEDWRVANYLTGSAVGLTTDGDLLVSDLAPFRITRYMQLDPGRPVRIVVDEDVISSSELIRATAPESPGTLYQFRWTRSMYVGETTDGDILNVALYYSDRRGRPYSLWTVVTPEGTILASTLHDKAYRVWDRTRTGAYLASYDGYAMTLAVSVVLGDQHAARGEPVPRMADNDPTYLARPSFPR